MLILQRFQSAGKFFYKLSETPAKLVDVSAVQGVVSQKMNT